MFFTIKKKIYQKILIIVFTFVIPLAGCCNQVMLDPIQYSENKNDISSKVKITVEKEINGEGFFNEIRRDIKKDELQKVSDEILTLVKDFNKNIKNQEYKLKIKYTTDFSPNLFIGEDGVGNLTLGSLIPGTVMLIGGPLAFPFYVVGGAFILVSGVVAGTYQILGGPWWTTATVKIDAQLTYHSKVIGEYKTEGIPTSQLISCWYGQCLFDADRTAEAKSFKLGLEDILKQIQVDGGNQSKKKTEIQKKEKAVEEAKEKERIEKQEERENFKKKYGKYKCTGVVGLKWNLYFDLGHMGRDFNESCIHNLIFGENFQVLQQTSEGTIASAFTNPEVGNVYMFIEKNPTDSKLDAGDIVPAGFMDPTGRYTYQTISGTTKTIYKFKRVSNYKIVVKPQL